MSVNYYYSYEQLDIIQKIDPVSGFTRVPPPVHGIPDTVAVRRFENLSYQQWLKRLKDQNKLEEWNIFEWDNGRLVGFGLGAKRLFRLIAQNLRSLHRQNMYCGDVLGRMRIRMPGTIVSFPCLPLNSDILSGIKSDVEHFRFMVGRLLADHIPLDVKTQEFLGLPEEFNLFFSKVLTQPMDNIFDALEMSYYQLFHPLFFGPEDRFKFFRLLMDYRSKEPKIFDKHLGLTDSKYGLGSWHATIPHNGVFDTILKHMLHDHSRKRFNPKVPLPATFKNYHSVLPRYVRHVHFHFANHEKVKSHDHVHYENELNKLFPGLCAKILDAIVRHLNNAFRAQMDCKLVDVLEMEGLGFFSEDLSEFPIGYKDGGDGGGSGNSDGASSSAPISYAQVVKGNSLTRK